ncbi:MAG: ABC transporter ATP-binding protein [Thermoleophilia bacterium]|nr:ABC transporter ATP-binding protein [Thermoleophilia bacterium]
MNNDIAITARGLDVHRGGAHVLRGITLDVPRGSVVGLLGPSGSGKSTLIRAVVGVQRNVTGDLTVLGVPAGTPALRRRVGYVTQAPSVYDDLSVHANVAYFGRMVGAPAARAAESIAEVGLADKARARVADLSGGQRSRVSLASALVGEPELLVLDEPTVGLDPVLRRDLWAMFHRIAARGRTLLVSSHVMDEATRCDRLLLLRDGRLVADTTPADLMRDTGATDAEAAFLALIDRAEVAP